jgi:hypothetical protein
MKNGKKPTVAQCEHIAAYIYRGRTLNPANWLVVKNLPDLLVIKSREGSTVIEIPVVRF